MTAKFIGSESLGEALHVALRKGCDSPATTAAHICVGLMPNSLWGEYVETVGDYLGLASQQGRLTEANAWEHLKYVSTGEDTDQFKQAHVAFHSKLRQWRRVSATPALTKIYGEYKTAPVKPAPPKRYEPLKAPIYDPGYHFRRDRDNHRYGRSLSTRVNIFPSEELIQKRDRFRYLFFSILRTFTDDDWKGYACFLFETEH